MEKYYADTNIFLRFLLDDIPFQAEEAKKYLEKAKKQVIELICCPIVIFEIDFSLRKLYGFDRTKVVDALATIIGMPFLNIEDRAVFQEALLMYSRNNLDLVDCFLFYKAQFNQAQVLSFDKDLKKLKNL